jgi:hypothetical protein
MSTRRTTLRTAGKAASILFAIGGLWNLAAAGSPIGMVTTNGNFQVDHSRVWGNSTVFDGSLIETMRAASQIQLNNGVQMRLGAETRATVFQGRLVLESGQGEMAPAHGYEVQARTLRITAVSPDAMARVRLDNGRRVLVAALRGSLKVTNAAGVMVARLGTGDALNFEPQAAGATAPTHASGCLLEKGGKFILVDRTTNLILELTGAALAAQTGNRVEVTGRTEGVRLGIDGVSQVVAVTDMKMVARGGCGAVAKKVGASASAAGAVGAVGGAAAGGAAGAAAAGGAATGAAGAGAAAAGATGAGIGAGTVAVIGGVAAAATTGGLAVAGDLPGQGNTPTSASR